jgi:predicted Zn-dependent protease
MTSAEDVATEEALTSVDGASAELLWRRVSFEARHGGVIESPAQRSVEHLVSHMRRSGWQGPEVRVGVLASDKPNAFVLVSGHLYVTRGLLDVICDDAELAAVVAHELSHFDDPEAFYAQGLSLSERLEIEAGADEAAVDLLLDASFDPVALARMIARLTNDQPEGWAERRCAYLSHRLNEPLGVLP